MFTVREDAVPRPLSTKETCVGVTDGVGALATESPVACQRIASDPNRLLQADPRGLLSFTVYAKVW